MGLSTTAAYGILFTASLVMLATLLNSIIYSYTLTNQGMENRSTLLESSKNIIKIEKIVYNSSKIQIIAYNQGPLTLNMNYSSLLVNGSVMNFTYQSQYWYPGTQNIIYVNTTYTFGSYHNIQFTMDVGDKVLASAELDKIYILNSTALAAYSYSGHKVWSISVNDPIDVSVGGYVYVLNSTEILIYTLSGSYVSSFGANLKIIAIDTYGSYVYGISSTDLYIFNSTGSLLYSTTIVNGKDVTVGKYLYVLEGNYIYQYYYNGSYISNFTDSHITNATKISADPEMNGGYLFVLNNENEILVYNNGSYVTDILLSSIATNINVYGKIYLSSSGISAMDMGYRIKLVDEYGNEVYGYL